MGIKLSEVLSSGGLEFGDGYPLSSAMIAEAERLEALEDEVLETLITLGAEDSLAAGRDVVWVALVGGDQVIGYREDGCKLPLRFTDLIRRWKDRRDAELACEEYNQTRPSDESPRAIPWPLPMA